MGIKLISNDTVAPWNSKVVPPVTRGLEAWFTFDTDASRFTLNRAIGKANASMAGNPQAFATHGRFKGNTDFLATQVKDSDQITLLAVARAVVTPTGDDDGVCVVGTYAGFSAVPELPGYAGGTSLLLRQPLGVAAGSPRSSGGVPSTAEVVGPNSGGAPTTWRLLAMRTKSGDVTKVFDLTNNLSASGSNTSQRPFINGVFRIGSPVSASTKFTGSSDISAVAIYSTYLTDAEINAVATAMRKRMARLGVAV